MQHIYALYFFSKTKYVAGPGPVGSTSPEKLFVVKNNNAIYNSKERYIQQISSKNISSKEAVEL